MSADDNNASSASAHSRGRDAAPETVGKYRVDDVIGRGAIGVVYKGFDPHICRAVAIKSLRSEVLEGVEDQAALLARFAAEARSAGRCQHPNIVTVYDYVEQDDTPFIIMEFVEAGTLERVTRSRTLLPLPQVAEVMAQLLAALGHAHDKGVIHRDVKPANILCPAATSIKVTDFGVARFQNLGLTRDGGGGAIGTPNYMSPEQFLGREVDGRADLFAAGIIMYQLLTGAKPYPADDIPSLMHKLLNEAPPPVSQLRPELPASLDALMTRALQRNPTDRFQSAEEFIREIESALQRASAAPSERIDLTSIAGQAASHANDASTSELSRTMAERLAPATLHGLEESLARAIGPIARVVLNREAKSATDPDRLIAALQTQIPGMDDAERFRKAAEVWLRDDRGVAGAQLSAVITEADKQQATELLLPIIGPLAQVIARREAATAIGLDDYYEHLARRIPSDEDRDRFLTAYRKAKGAARSA
ncbi:MAG: serine/threonine protein kinase [Alphaproteobacteria bacterium]|nr:serine/threonine protein kinase [Alphaproteobacteria bacterium]